MILSGADIIVKTLIEQGCDVVFGYPGGQILDVYDSLYKHENEITHVLSAHEQGAAHAADGYARASGKTGVVISTSGPGATNLVTGIATAHLDSVPMVVICGNVATSQIGTDSFQEIDITGITLPITKHNYFVSDVSELADTIREAFVIAQSGRPGPVLIDVPKDVQTAMWEYIKADPIKKAEPMAAKQMRIVEAANYINTSKRPYIYFGGGIISANAQKQMLELAEKIDAPMGCSMMGLASIDTNEERFLGMQGMHGHFASSMAMHNADCIIALGVRFNDRVTGNRERFASGASIVHIDVDGSELSKNVDALGLRGDLKPTLSELLKLVNESKKPQWQEQIKSLKEEELLYTDVRSSLTPRNAILTLNRYLNDDMCVATDVGQHQMWTVQNLSFSKNRSFATSGGLGTMGYGLGAAIGQFFATKKHSVLITGDGSFGMSLNELATAVTYNVPVLILIMNNSVLGMVRQWQTMFFNKRHSNTTLDRKTDFTALAKAFGANGEKVDTLGALENAIKKGISYNGPYIIDCTIDKDEVVLPMLPPGGSTDDIILEEGK